jgi:RNA polymerase sigma-70 factor (ECF subfamily)
MDFTDLYDRYARDVHRFSLFLSGNEAMAEDLTAETFARALLRRDQLRVDTVKAYLLAIARNLYRDALRAERRLVSIDEAPHAHDPAPRQDVLAGDKRRLQDVVAAIQRLPATEREALLLATGHELPYDRIAAILGCSTAAVKVRVHRGRVRLKSLLDCKERS